MKTSYYFDARSYGRRLQQGGLSEGMRKSLRTAVPLAFFLLGLLYGALLLKEDETLLARLFTIQQTTLTDRLQSGFASVFWQSLGSNLLFLVVSTLCGFWAVGQPLSLLCLLARGLGLGGLVGSLFLQYQLSGIGYAVVLLIPGAVVGVFALLLSVRESMCLSNVLFRWMLGKETEIHAKMVRLYLLKQMILLVFILVAALLDGIFALLATGMLTL